MTFGSLFAGVGGFDLGFERSGLSCKWQVERDKNCLKVLRHHWPSVTKYEDVRNVGKENLDPVDVICGGFPCTDLSVAGNRKGLAGEASGLWHEFRRILEECRPGICVIENVPGLLSSNGGRDFSIVLRGLEDIGYRVAWRTLDARYWGVAQRRRRVFIVGSLGDGRAAEILFESEGLRRNPETGEAQGQEVAGTLGGGSGQRGWNIDLDGSGAFGDPANDNIIAFTQEETPKFGDLPGALDSCEGRRNSVAIPAVGVRRLTPTECARLQGFPDDHNAFLADGPRYKQFGNAVCVNVAEWIGRRLMSFWNGK